jgi:hypothetical protein
MPEAALLKTVKLKLFSGELRLYKNVLEFYSGKLFFVLVLDSLQTSVIDMQNVMSVEVKRLSGEFARVNLKWKKG